VKNQGTKHESSGKHFHNNKPIQHYTNTIKLSEYYQEDFSLHVIPKALFIQNYHSFLEMTRQVGVSLMSS